MSRPKKISVKDCAILCLVFAILLFVTAIVFSFTQNSAGAWICIVACCLFAIPAILYYIKYRKFRKAKKALDNRSKTLSDLTDTLINNLAADCSDAIRQQTKQDVIRYACCTSEKKIIGSEQNLLHFIHAVLLYNYENLNDRFEKIRVDHNIYPVDWNLVKKETCFLIADHFNNSEEPFDCKDEVFIEKIKQILEHNTYIATGQIRINRKDPSQ